MTELLDYHGYGNSRLTSGATTAKKTFIGQYSDTETSLSYLNARYYDSVRGQFMSEDSVFLGMGGNKVDKKIMTMTLLDPQSQNSYSYARDNPIRFLDFTGNSWFSSAMNGAASVSDSVFNFITYGSGNRINEMVQSGATPGKIAGVVAGVVGGAATVGAGGAIAGALVGAIATWTGVTTVASSITGQTGIAIGTSFGKLGTVIANQAGKITGFIREGSEVPYHGLDQSISRLVSTRTLFETVTKPLVTLQQSGGNIMYLTEKAAVILNQAGRVVTAYGATQFAQHVLNVLSKISK